MGGPRCEAARANKAEPGRAEAQAGGVLPVYPKLLTGKSGSGWLASETKSPEPSLAVPERDITEPK